MQYPLPFFDRWRKRTTCDGCTATLTENAKRQGNRVFCGQRCLDFYLTDEYNKSLVRAAGMQTHYLVGAIALAFFLLWFTFTPKAHAHEYYHKWLQPGTSMSCCNERKVSPNGDVTGDCIETRAEMRNGTWYAWITHENKWVEIPDSRIIRERNPTGESAHVCYDKGKVLCFVPPDTGG